jgi:hypothetical protein
MNINCKLSLTDEQRNNIKQHLAGKNVKALATRADICQLIQDLLEPLLEPPRPTREAKPGEIDEHFIEQHRQAEIDFCSDECCKQNQLLLHRMNVLQHRLDTNAK